MAESQRPLTVKCPQCNRPVLWTSDYPYRPFCCERCKLIDLGEWAMEEKIIPGDPVPNGNEDDDNPFFQ